MIFFTQTASRCCLHSFALSQKGNRFFNFKYFMMYHIELKFYPLYLQFKVKKISFNRYYSKVTTVIETVWNGTYFGLSLTLAKMLIRYGCW